MQYPRFRDGFNRKKPFEMRWADMVLPSGAIASLYIPLKMTLADIEHMQKYLDLYMTMFQEDWAEKQKEDDDGRTRTTTVTAIERREDGGDCARNGEDQG